MSSPPPSPDAARWSPLLVFAIALALLAGFAAAHEVAAPFVHDEFAYLLSADTFLQGRLTNPPHPLAIHFETFHVFHDPTYQAKYPPAQGLALALGQWIAHPIVGVWLSWSAALAAIAWMLAAVVPARQAFLGALLLLANPYLFLVWGGTYWGGAVAAGGGALFFGGLLRLRHRLAWSDGLAMGLGVFVLGNSRPFEGVATVALALGILAAAVRRRLAAGEERELFLRVLLPFGLGVAALVLWTLHYDRALTGNPFQLPYFNYHPELSPHEDIRSYTGSPSRSFAGKSLRLAQSFLGVPLMLAFPFVVRRRRDPFVAIAAAIAYVVGVLVLAGSRGWPHYVAPVTCLIAFLSVASLRGLWGWRWRHRRVGHALAALVLLAHLGLWLDAVVDRIAHGSFASWARDREEMIASLEARGGKHLVLVRYGPERERDKEWIYNAADIDGATVVWARDLGVEGNRALFAHYPDRTRWLVEVPPYRTQLRPYAPAGADEEQEPAWGE